MMEKKKHINKDGIELASPISPISPGSDIPGSDSVNQRLLPKSESSDASVHDEEKGFCEKKRKAPSPSGTATLGTFIASHLICLS